MLLELARVITVGEHEAALAAVVRSADGHPFCTVRMSVAAEWGEKIHCRISTSGEAEAVVPPTRNRARRAPLPQ
jgi:hypothetical protein